MAIQYLKRASKTPATDSSRVDATVAKMLADIRANGEDAARRYAQELDGYRGELVVSREQLTAADAALDDAAKDSIRFAHDNIRRFAESQKATLQDTSIEVIPGVFAGQKNIPCTTAGCYVPGGRYSHIASAMMTVTTAKVAGCQQVIVCSPPQGEAGIPPALLWTANLCGADTIVAMGGVQAVAVMAFGLCGLPRADILVGPGNQYVAAAKRQLFGECGIDMLAGPTDSFIIADDTADANVVAADLVGQAEHGYNSPVWLATTARPLADAVMARVPQLIADLPETNRKNAAAAWQDYAEVMLCDTREEMADAANRYAPEHLSVQAADLDWWLDHLACYGSLFLGEETTVAYGDKATGTNHVLPTNRAARYTGGLSVHKFIKTVTWQRASRTGSRPIATATAAISRLEGMEAHARSADARLSKYAKG